MASTFERCGKDVDAMAAELLELECYEMIRVAKVRIDFVFAYAEKDDNDKPIGDALSKNGIKCLGICRKISLKDRALGRADAEISLDGDWWKENSDSDRKALLDHEMYHIGLKTRKGGFVFDDLNRPVVKLRKHDVEVGWFKAVAARHGSHSQERIQARQIMDDMGQFFWPDLFSASERKAAIRSLAEEFEEAKQQLYRDAEAAKEAAATITVRDPSDGSTHEVSTDKAAAIVASAFARRGNGRRK